MFIEILRKVILGYQSYRKNEIVQYQSYRKSLERTQQ